MTLIAKYANALKMFFTSFIRYSEGQRFKIFIRTGFQIDAYLFVHDCQNFKDIAKKFDSFCKNTPEFSDLKPVEGNDYIRIFLNVLPVSDLEDPFYFNIANTSNDIDRGPRYRFDSFYSTSIYELKKNNQTKIPIITFYSHKGGVGRTTAMTSYALHLAKEGKNVAVIDCDLEAPGYLNFFDLSEHEELLEGKKNGLVEFLCDSQFLGEEVNVNNYMINVGARNRNNDYQPALNRIWLIPAGNLNEGVTERNAFKSQGRHDYIEGLAKLNLGNTQKVIKGFTSLFEQLRSIDIDAILIDSRTGFNDIFGTATLHLSSCVVGFFGLSRQNEPGLINLLEKHIENENLFKLILAYSILPENFENDSILNQAFDRMESFVMEVYAEKEVPPRIPIHRNTVLERLGTGDNDAEERFIEMNISTGRELQFQDYTQLFDEIDKKCFPQKSHLRIVPSKPTKEYGSLALRNIVLQHLKNVLADAAMPAENISFNPDTCYLRSCMHEKSGFFDEKFIICGRKGTGKTYFCKAIRDPRVLGRVREMASEYIFIDALTNERKDYMYLIQAVKYMFVKKEDFLNFWRICLWAKLMFDESIKGLSEIRTIVKQQSALTHEYDDNIFVSVAFVELMNVDKLLNIVKDLHRFNEELRRANKTIYILYDHLESFIQPENWNEAVSSLINYWMGSGHALGNILPKIFIRTDLLSQVENLNTELSPNNILNIEWSIEEVFDYFFKLVFSDPTAADALWILAEIFNVDSYYIHEMKKKFKTNDHLYIGRSRVEMENLIRIFFGSDTKKYGKPWDYFKKELSNADYTVNQQAFINILNKNAVDKALAIAESDVTEIISPDIYTSTDVRTFAVTELFKSYTTDAFCKDLIEFQYIVLFTNDGKYRYKSLDGIKFESLINETCKRLDVPNTGKYKTRLINSIISNGIMATKQTTKGEIYEFAPLYWFPWGLQDESPQNEILNTTNEIQKAISETIGGSDANKVNEVIGTIGSIVGTVVGNQIKTPASAVAIAADIAQKIIKLTRK